MGAVRRRFPDGFIAKRALLRLLVAAGAACGLGRPAVVRAQGDYVSSTLACARFAEEVRAELTTEMGGRTRRTTAGRDGVLVVRGRPDSGSVRLEAWYDSLSVWRQGPEGRVEPDPDGFIGGRFGGRLGPRGRYLPIVRPFVPDEIAEIVRLDRMLEDFFPLLPPNPLEPGAAWADSAGSEIRRLADSVAGGVALGRFAYARPATLAPADPAAVDSLTPGLTEEGRETGRFVWHPRDGLVRIDREITVTASVPAGRFVRAPVRSRLVQRIGVAREGAGCGADAR